MDKYLAVMIDKLSNKELDSDIIEDTRTEWVKEHDDPCYNGVGRHLMFKAVDHFRDKRPEINKGWYVDMVLLDKENLQ